MATDILLEQRMQLCSSNHPSSGIPKCLNNGCGSYFYPISSSATSGGTYALHGNIRSDDVYKNSIPNGSSLISGNEAFHFSPIGKSWQGSNSSWISSTYEDFDVDGQIEIAVAREFDSKVFFVKYDNAAINRITSSLVGQIQTLSIASITSFRTATGVFLAVLPKNGNVLEVYQNNSGIWSQSLINIPYPNTVAGQSLWVDLTAGDLDGDGVDEIILLDQQDFYVIDYPSGAVRHQSSHGSSSDWRAITAGDFDGDNLYEFVAVREFDNTFYMYEEISGSLFLIDSYSYGSALSFDWKDMASGRLAYPLRDVFGAIAGSTSDIYFYELDNGIITRTGGERETFPTIQEINAICFPDLISCNNAFDCRYDEVFIAKNLTGDMFIYQTDFERESSCHALPDPDDDERVAKTVGLRSNLSDVNAIVYPNPSSGMVNLKIGDVDQMVKFIVYDRLGAIVKPESIIESSIETFSIEHPGIYFVQILTESNSITKRIVIQ